MRRGDSGCDSSGRRDLRHAADRFGPGSQRDGPASSHPGVSVLRWRGSYRGRTAAYSRTGQRPISVARCAGITSCRGASSLPDRRSATLADRLLTDWQIVSLGLADRQSGSAARLDQTAVVDHDGLLMISRAEGSALAGTDGVAAGAAEAAVVATAADDEVGSPSSADGVVAVAGSNGVRPRGPHDDVVERRGAGAEA
jgi:hypothetical protein